MLQPDRSLTDVNFEGYKLFPQYPAQKRVVSLPVKTTGRYLEESTRTTFKQASTHFHFNQLFPHQENGKSDQYIFYYFDDELFVNRITSTFSGIGQFTVVTPRRLFRIPSDTRIEEYPDADQKQFEEPSLCALKSLDPKATELLIISDGEGRVYLYHGTHRSESGGEYRAESILEGGCLCLEELENNVESISAVTILDACWMMPESSPSSAPQTKEKETRTPGPRLCVAVEHVTVEYPIAPQRKEDIESDTEYRDGGNTDRTSFYRQHMDAARQAPHFVSSSSREPTASSSSEYMSEEHRQDQSSSSNDMQNESDRTVAAFRHRSKPTTVFHLSILTFSPATESSVNTTTSGSIDSYPYPYYHKSNTSPFLQSSGFFPNVMTSRSHFEAVQLFPEKMKRSERNDNYENNDNKDNKDSGNLHLEIIAGDAQVRLSPDFMDEKDRSDLDQERDNDNESTTPMSTGPSGTSLTEMTSMMDIEGDESINNNNNNIDNNNNDTDNNNRYSSSEMLPYTWEQDEREIRVGVDLQPIFQDVFTATYHLLDNFTVKMTPHTIVIEEPGDGNRKYMERELYSKINVQDSYWTIENGNQCVLYLEKETPQRWPSPFSPTPQLEPGALVAERTSEGSTTKQEEWTLRGSTLMTEEMEDSEEADTEDTTPDYYTYQTSISILPSLPSSSPSSSSSSSSSISNIRNMSMNNINMDRDALSCSPLHRISWGAALYLCHGHDIADRAYLGVRSGIDGLVLQGRSLGQMEETVTAFNALGYILDGKRSKKFITVTPDLKHAAVVEYNGVAYIYDAHVTADHTARHNVVDLSGEDVMGVGTLPGCILVLCRRSLVIIEINGTK